MNKDYIVISSGLFKDSPVEEAVVDKELQQKVVIKSRRSGYSHSLNRTMAVLHTGEAGLRAFGEAIHRELESQLNSSRTLTGTPITFGTAGEYQLENEQMWADTRNDSVGDIQPPIGEYIAGHDPYTQTQDSDSITITRNMTEQEIINHFDTISNEEQQTNTEH